MSHSKPELDTERAYAVKNKPETFVEQAKYATLDMNGDEVSNGRLKNGIKWDSKKKKYITTTIGADNKKRIRTESGMSIPASYKSDR